VLRLLVLVLVPELLRLPAEKLLRPPVPEPLHLTLRQQPRRTPQESLHQPVPEPLHQ
jgi:hypothetical protein